MEKKGICEHVKIVVANQLHGISWKMVGRPIGGPVNETVVTEIAMVKRHDGPEGRQGPEARGERPESCLEGGPNPKPQICLKSTNKGKDLFCNMAQTRLEHPCFELSGNFRG